MASGTYVPTGSALAEKLYRPGLWHETERQAYMLGFASTDEDAGIYQIDDFTKKRGDTVQYRFSPTDDTRDGFLAGDNIQNNLADVEVLYDELKINWLGEAFGSDDPMTQQRVSWSVKKTCFTKATKWWSRRFEQWILNQLAGYTPAMGASGTDYRRTGMNAVTALDSAHIYRPSGSTDQGLTSSHKISLDHINQLTLRCMSKSYLDWPIAPLSDGFYHLVIHPIQWFDLRENTSAGEWGDIQRAVLEGGKPYEQSAWVRGFAGAYGMVKIHVSDYVPLGVNSSDSTASVSTVRRAVLIGQNAGCLAFGEGYADGNHLDWTEKVFDFKKWGVLADTVGGFKRTTFTPTGGSATTYGCMVLSTYAAA